MAGSRRWLVFRKCVALSASMCALMGGWAALSTRPVAAAVFPTGCGTVLFQGARGSGQPWQGNSSDGYTGFGPQVYSLYKQLTVGLTNVQVDSIGQVLRVQ